ncbi:MAG: hypothetical protein WBX20_08130 [Terrimicrobiaceae bacterium]
MPSLIVGIFENAENLDRAVERLAGAGFEDAVYDQAIVAGELGNAGQVPVGPVIAAGAVRVKPLGDVEPDLPDIVRKFKSDLAGYHLPEQVVETYAATLSHKGTFVLVKTEPERAAQAREILRECRASRVNQHD